LLGIQTGNGYSSGGPIDLWLKASNGGWLTASWQRETNWDPTQNQNQRALPADASREKQPTVQCLPYNLRRADCDWIYCLGFWYAIRFRPGSSLGTCVEFDGWPNLGHNFHLGLGGKSCAEAETIRRNRAP
jgi:hypothetical protein